MPAPQRLHAFVNFKRMSKMKRLVLLCGLLSALLLTSCWPFDRKRGDDYVAKGSYHCDTGKVTVNYAGDGGRSEEYRSLEEATAKLAVNDLSRLGAFVIRQAIEDTCVEAPLREAALDRPGMFMKVAETSQRPAPRNLLLKTEKKGKSRKVSFVLTGVEVGESANEVYDYVKGTLNDSPCAPTSKRCIACRRPNKYYRTYCSVPTS